ncbi:hypothetical protein [Riemerella anatipestifer]|uniref:hypothetical protein n=1 Tax=Riemerella anatipestifer TaxID=34085 RepID=UPI001AD645BB|nr:hypothetical protein [Riemerella anatipestifer]MBO4234793.1 hypothetical protein [Riemerella anatipestifer]MCW0518776.1 hypothetical protein [Riemerella anatipestifer]
MNNRILYFLKKNSKEFNKKFLAFVQIAKYKDAILQNADDEQMYIEFCDLEIFINRDKKYHTREFHIKYENIIECNVSENVLFIKYFDKDQGDDKITYDFEIKI